MIFEAWFFGRWVNVALRETYPSVHHVLEDFRTWWATDGFVVPCRAKIAGSSEWTYAPGLIG